MIAATAKHPAHGWVFFFLLLGVGVFWSVRAAASESEDFYTAPAAYQAGDYARAVELFEAMVGGDTPAIRDPVLIQESREYLAAAYVLLGQRALAARQFEDMLRAEPHFERYQLDPTAFPQAVLDVFSEVHQRLVRERQTDEAARARRAQAAEARRREALLRLIDLAEENEVEIAHDRAIAWLPFGAGQFQNGDAALGTFFLTTQALALLTAVVTFSVWVPLDAMRHQYPPVYVDTGALWALHVANWVSLGTLGLSMIAGVVEAHVNFVPSHRERRARTVPPALLEDLDLTVGPGSVGLRLRF